MTPFCSTFSKKILGCAATEMSTWAKASRARAANIAGVGFVWLGERGLAFLMGLRNPF